MKQTRALLLSLAMVLVFSICLPMSAYAADKLQPEGGNLADEASISEDDIDINISQIGEDDAAIFFEAVIVAKDVEKIISKFDINATLDSDLKILSEEKEIKAGKGYYRFSVAKADIAGSDTSNDIEDNKKADLQKDKVVGSTNTGGNVKAAINLNKTISSSNAPKTGDQLNLYLAILLICILAISCVLLGYILKHRKKYIKLFVALLVGSMVLTYSFGSKAFAAENNDKGNAKIIEKKVPFKIYGKTYYLVAEISYELIKKSANPEGTENGKDNGSESENPQQPEPKPPTIDEEKSLAIKSLEKINSNPQLKMPISYMMGREDVEADITPKELAEASEINLTSLPVEDYHFLALATSLESLDLGNQQDLEDKDIKVISGLKNLKKLVLAGNPEITDLSPIKDLTSLEILMINETNVTDLSPLAKLVNLRELAAYELGEGHHHGEAEEEAEDEHDKEFNLTALNMLVNLEKLDLTEVPISDFSFLKKMNSMKELSLEGCGLTSLESIKGAKGITHLRIGKNHIKSLEPISEMRELEYLEADSNELTELPELKDLTKLKFINVADNKINSIDGLKGMKSLTDLKLNKNPLEGRLEPVGDLTSLKSLYIDEVGADTLEAVKALKNLQILNAKKNKISDITPILGLDELQEILLGENRIAGENLDKLWSKDANISLDDQILVVEKDRNEAIKGFEFLKNMDINVISDDVTYNDGIIAVKEKSLDKDSVKVSFSSKKNTYNKKLSGSLTIKLIGELVKEKTVQSVNEIAPVEVKYGASKQEWEAKLPSEITLNLSDNTSAYVNVTWNGKNVNTWQEGEYKAKAVYELPEGVTGEAPVVEALIKVGAKPQTPKVQLISEGKLYYKDNPQIELKNFESIANVSVSREISMYPYEEELQLGKHFTFDSNSKIITINTANIYNKSNSDFSYDEELSLQIDVDGQKYPINISYSKSKQIYVFPKEYTELEHGKDIKVSLVADEEDEAGISLYIGDEAIKGFEIVKEDTEYGETTYIKIPYEAVKNRIVDNAVTVIGRHDDVKDFDFTLRFKSDEAVTPDPDAGKSPDDEDGGKETVPAEGEKDPKNDGEETSSDESKQLKQWKAEAIEIEDNGRTPDDNLCVYVYGQHTTINLELEFEGLTRKFLEENLRVMMQSGDYDEFEVKHRNKKAANEDGSWYLRREPSNNKVELRLNTDYSYGKVAYKKKDDKWQITNIKLNLPGYEEKVVKVVVMP